MSQQHIIDIDEMEEGEERFAKQLERAQVYYQALIEVLEPFRQGLSSLIKHLQTERGFSRHHPENGAGLHIALQYKDLGRYDQAVPLLEECLQLQPTHPDALYHLADIYVQQGRYDAALALLETGKQVHAQVRGMQKLYDTCRQKREQWQERVRQACQQSAADVSPSPVDALLAAGNFYFRVHDLERAKTEYRKVLAAHPHLSEAHYALAHTYFAEEDFTAGVAALESALLLAPDNPAIYRDLGLVAYKHGQDHQAERFILKAIELTDSDPSLYEILGQIYVQRHDWLHAAEAYEVLLHLDPQRLDILQNLALVYQKQIAASLD